MKTEITTKLLNKSYRTVNITLYEEHINKEELHSILSHIKSIEKYAFILHDKDKLANGIDIKKSHFHVLIRFSCSVKGINFIPRLTKTKNSETNAIEKMRDTGAYIEPTISFKNSLLYLIHKSSSSRKKFQYSPDEVIANFDYKNEIKEYTENDRGDYVKQQIDNYTIGEINLVELRRNIDAIEFRDNENLIKRASNARVSYQKKISRNIKVYYF